MHIPENLEESYRTALEEILRDTIRFNDLWDTKPDTTITIVDAVVDQDECLFVGLKRDGATYGFSLQGSAFNFSHLRQDLYNAEDAAKEIRGATPHGKFYPEQWKGAFYKGIKKELGPILAQRELERRIQQ